MNLQLKLHSVLLSVGPTNCGKTTFFKTKLLPLLKSYGYNVGYISSDEIRTELLGESIDKYNSLMIEVSKQAFILLKYKLECYISFPVNKQFVIVDTTGLNEEFRTEILSICNKHNYILDSIIFDYSNIHDYFMFDGNKKIIKNHIERLKKSLKSINVSTKHIMKNRETLINDELAVCIKDDILYKKCISKNKTYLVVGDIHGCIDEFKQLLLNVGFIIDDNNYIKITEKTSSLGIILVGDIIDKGSPEKIHETIEFIHKNLSQSQSELNFNMVMGNHEGAVYNLLTGKTKESEYKPNFINTYYNSYPLLKSNENLCTKFYEIIDKSLPFFHNISNHGTFYVTHSPCELKYIGKLDPKSIKKQMYTFLDRDRTIIENMNHYMDKNGFNLPYHIIGHLAINKVYDGKSYDNNILMIDTGCIYNNKLTGVVIGENYGTYKEYNVPFMNIQSCVEEPLQSMISSDVKNVDNFYKTIEECDQIYSLIENDLDKEIKYRINNLISDKINYISGTIAPAPQNKNKTNLEDLEEGLLYYKNKGFSKVCLQIKYMGSRCNIYLFRDIHKSYSVSRNGRVITSLNQEEMLNIYQHLLDNLLPFMNQYSIEMMILDGELMPWSAMGQGLIEKCFRVPDVGINSEIQLLKETGFSTKINEHRNKISMTDFASDIRTMKKSEMIDKYGKNEMETNRHILFGMKHIPTLEEKEIYHKLYKEQIDLYSVNEKVRYKPFGILKIIKTNSDEIMPGIKDEINVHNNFTQFEIFKLVSNDSLCIVDFSHNDWLQQAQLFFDNVTTKNNMEGIVIKPELFDLNYAINIKVRNPDYLSIIYGYDYLHKSKYDKLIAKKNIKHKLQISIKEANKGYQLLKQSYSSIDDNRYKLLLIDFMGFEKKEEQIDPRL